MSLALPVADRKLHLGHFAFMRAVIQGIPLRDSWDRYLRIEGEATDVRRVRSTIGWIRDAFAAAARRHRRPGMARLVLVDIERIARGDHPLPTLQDFADARGLEGFSESEQIAAYESHFGPALARSRRRERLITRQLQALHWLETLVAEPPHAQDAPAAWFAPALAGRLEAIGLTTLERLVTYINGIGRHWTRALPGVGPVKAARIEHWLRTHSSSIGHELGRHVAMPRSMLKAAELAEVMPPATDIRPLEKFLVPAALDGRQGRYRQPKQHCLLDAGDDYAALLAWLGSKDARGAGARPAGRAKSARGESPAAAAPLSHTRRAYRREAERFLLWTIIERGKALSSVTPEDCAAYRDFLADPQPASRWCGPRARARWSPLWRPFEGPLSPAAQRQAVTVLRNLYGYLVDHNYLMGNPWSGIRASRQAAPRLDPGRSFTASQWAFIEARLDLLTPSSVNRRLALAVRLLYATGLRLQEVIDARVGDLRWVTFAADALDSAPAQGWLLTVLGKGARLREVPVPQDVIAALGDYLASRGCDAEPMADGNVGEPLLARATDLVTRLPGLAAHLQANPAQPGVAASTLYGQLKRFFGECAVELDAAGRSADARRFRAASTHWLRHTHASHAIARGMPIEVAQQNLGHASLATTTRYVNTELRARMQAVDSFWSAARGRP